MPVFTFSGKDASGQKISGERIAANKQSLAQALRRERITPGAIREKGKEFSMPTFGSGSVKTKDIAIFFRQFSVMIDAGLPLVQCLEILAARKPSPVSGPPLKAAPRWPMPCVSIRSFSTTSPRT
jgi:type IV pilus assembly protein PilC